MIYTKDCGRRKESWPGECGEHVQMTALKARWGPGCEGTGATSLIFDLRHLFCESQIPGISHAGAESPGLSYQPV